MNLKRISLVTVLAATLLVSASAKDPVSLKPLLVAQKMELGAAVMPDYLGQADYAATLKNNFTYLTPENNLKWESVHPARKVYNFTPGDTLWAFAQANGMTMRGHTLIWHNQNPAWLANLPDDPAVWTEVLKDHITTVMTHFQGKIRDWDVVNECLEENGTLRKTPWSTHLGPDYVAQALTMARAADPAARLFVNDYGTEGLGGKADAFYALIKGLVDRKVPLDGVGFQFHLDGRTVPDYSAVARNFARFAALGLEVQITELDVRLPVKPTDANLAQQAGIYRELAKILLGTGAGKTMIVWGVTDKYSWVPGFFKDSDAALLFDGQYQPKPAVASLVSLLSGPRPGPNDVKRYLDSKPIRSIPPMRVPLADQAPVADGKVGAGEWDKAYTIPLIYNQLSGTNLTFDPKQMKGTLSLLYKGDTLYGLLRRTDPVTFTGAQNDYENDNFELFWRTPSAFHQWRTIVGQDWEAGMGANGKAVWSADGTVLEFTAITGTNLAGKTLGFMGALSSNDGSSRWVQAYPVPGGNTGYLGRGFGEATFQQADGVFADGDLAGDLPDYQVKVTVSDETSPGVLPGMAWLDAVKYPFGYDQLAPLDQARVSEDDLWGTWSLLVSGDQLYGRVERRDDTLVKGRTPARLNDGVELTYQFEEGQPQVLYTAVGSDFDNPPAGAKASWSADSRVLRFKVPLPAAGQTIHFSLGLVDYDDPAAPQPVHALYPWPGYVRSGQPWNAGDADLAAQMNRKTAETATIKLP